mmetsp:Transcript_7693/g.21847  ORF Transcript_7693/g.21847 Transcript_7693/m.21847 type:complete len:204 (-) Transcript_7693:163-774(-)
MVGLNMHQPHQFATRHVNRLLLSSHFQPRVTLQDKRCRRSLRRARRKPLWSSWSQLNYALPRASGPGQTENASDEAVSRHQDRPGHASHLHSIAPYTSLCLPGPQRESPIFRFARALPPATVVPTIQSNFCSLEYFMTERHHSRRLKLNPEDARSNLERAAPTDHVLAGRYMARYVWLPSMSWGMVLRTARLCNSYHSRCAAL